MSHEANATVVNPLPAPLRGSASVPGDKSISHRAVLFAAMAEGTSRLSGVLDSEDVRSSIRAVGQLGAQVSLEKQPDGSLAGGVTGWGAAGPSQPDAPIDCGNSGTTVRLLMGVLAPWSVRVELTGDDDELMLATRQGQAIRFKETDIRAMGRNSMGVKSFDLSENDEVISVARIEEGKQVLAITQRTDVSEFRVQSRGGKGIMAMRLTERTGLMAAQLLVHEDEDIMLITDDGTIIRMPVSDISTIGRVSQGVRVMRVEEGSHIVCVTATERDEDEEEASEADGETMEPTEENSLDMDLGGENSENQPEETEE